jgi:GT2 family glycosyltransferase
MAENKIISFIDDDIHLPDNYFTVMRKAYEEYPEAAGIGGPAITTDRSLEKLVEILETDEIQNKFNKYGEVRDESDRWVPSKPLEVDTFRGANMSFRKEKLEEIGGFDPGYKGTGFREEQDVMVRLRKKGEKLIYHPELKLHHIRADTGGTRDANVETEYWKGRNMIKFVKKNFPETYHLFLIKMLFKTKDGDIPSIWKDMAGALIYRRPQRIHKWRGYIDEILG